MLTGLFEADLAIKTNVMEPEPALVRMARRARPSPDARLGVSRRRLS